MLAVWVTLLHSVSLQPNVSDMWQCIWGYSVCGVYQLLTSQESTHDENVADLIWHN